MEPVKISIIVFIYSHQNSRIWVLSNIVWLRKRFHNSSLEHYWKLAVSNGELWFNVISDSPYLELKYVSFE